MPKRNVLIVGLDPDRVDFSGGDYGAVSNKRGPTVKAMLAEGRLKLERRGFQVDLCMVVPGKTASAALRQRLDLRDYDYIAFGGGIRLNPANTDLFASPIGIAHAVATDAILCFNAGAGDTAGCVLRLSGHHPAVER